MERVIIVFSSITSANGVKNHLYKKYGIQTRIIQTPKNLSLTGCSYCLVANLSSLEKIKELIKENGISIKGIFTEDGKRI